MSERRGGNGGGGAEGRRAEFKFHGMTTEELRRRREENQVEIRKAKREDSLNKRRNMVVDGGAAFAGSSASGHVAAAMSDVGSPTSSFAPSSSADMSQRMSDLAQGLYSDDLTYRHKCLKEFRKILSKEHNPPISEVIDCGIVPRVVEILAGRELEGHQQQQVDPELVRLVEQLQFEAAWVLTNIASGTSEQTALVVESGAFGLFVQLLAHPSPELRGQSIWALGNISGESPAYRDITLNHDVMLPLLTTLNDEIDHGCPNGDLAKNTTWAISNLCRGKPAPAWDQIAPALPTLCKLLHGNDEDILGEACWAVAYMTDGSAKALADIIASGVIPRLVALLQSRTVLVQASCLRALGNIVTGDDQQTQLVIDNGALQAFARLFTSSSKSILREACWAISNVTAGTAEQIRAVIDANLIPPIIRLLSADYFSIKREACWAICNATSVHQTHPEIIKYLVSQGCIKPLCDILRMTDVKIIQVALDGLENILEVGQQEALDSEDHLNPYALFVEEAGGLEGIFELQNHVNMSVYIKSKQIIDKFFGEDDDAEEFDANDAAFEFNKDMHVPQGGFNF